MASDTLASKNGTGTPARRNGLSPAGRARVLAIQRARILAATVEELTERGAGDLTVAHIVARAGISRRTFYELFSDRDDCCLAALQDALERASAPVVVAYEVEAPWAVRVRAGLVALLGFLEAERAAGWLLVVGSLGGGPQVLEYRRTVLERVAAAIDQGRRAGKSGELPPMTAEGVLGGVLSVLHNRMATDRPRPLLELTGPLMAMIVLPYGGPAAAGRELKRAKPRPPRAREDLERDPLRKLGMRLTYRTVCVLAALATRRGASNRQLANACGISDQGQISKLLARLQSLGLIENLGRDAPPGGANAWQLTDRGVQVERALAEPIAEPARSGPAERRRQRSVAPQR